MSLLPAAHRLPADLLNAAEGQQPVLLTGEQAAEIVTLVTEMDAALTETRQALIDAALAETAGGS